MNFLDGLAPHVHSLREGLTEGLDRIACILKDIQGDIRQASQTPDFDVNLKRHTGPYAIGQTTIFGPVRPGRILWVEYVTADGTGFTLTTNGGITLFYPTFGVADTLFPIYAGESLVINATAVTNACIITREILETPKRLPRQFRQGIAHEDLISNTGLHDAERDFAGRGR